MASRFAVPTLNTLTKYRAERDVFLTQACINYNNHGDARTTMSLLASAREKHRKVLWARDYLHQRDIGAKTTGCTPSAMNKSLTVLRSSFLPSFPTRKAQRMTNTKTSNRSVWRFQAIELGNPFGPGLNCDELQEAVAWAKGRGINANVWRNLDGALVREIRIAS